MRHLPFYRSNAIRWTFILLGVFVIVSLSVVPLHRVNVPSVRVLSEVVPLPIICGLFAVYVILLLFKGCRRCLLAGCMLGGFLYMLNVFAAVVAGFYGQAVNPIGFAALILAVAAHYLSYRAVYFDHSAGA